MYYVLLVFGTQRSNCWYYRRQQLFSSVHLVTCSCFHNHKHTHTPALSLSSPCARSLSLHTDTNIPKCGLTANATTDFLFNVFQLVAQWHKTTFKKHDPIMTLCLCLGVLKCFVRCDSKHLNTFWFVLNMKYCMETFDFKSAALRVASCSLAQTKRVWCLRNGRSFFLDLY